MNINEYAKRMNNIQNKILEYLDKDDDNEEIFQNLIQSFEDLQIQNDKHNLKIVLHIILDVSNNYHRSSNFFTKIEQILKHFQLEIKKYFSNSDIFNIFKSNNRIILFLIQEQFILVDDQIAYKLLKYPQYFAPQIKPFFEKIGERKFGPELKPFIKEENDYNDEEEEEEEEENILNKELPDNFEEKRKIGENDSFICQLIRKDLIKEFIVYINKTNISPDSNIESSIYETNSFLINKKTSLIEYAAFFGSIQIFKYLLTNGATLKPSIFLYSIHGNNSEIIHILEENQIQPKEIEQKNQNEEEEENNDDNDILYKENLIESIKCHHNDLVQYIVNNYSSNNKSLNAYLVEFVKYHNFEFINLVDDVNFDKCLVDLCRYEHYYIVEMLLKDHKIDINQVGIHIRGKEQKKSDFMIGKGFSKSFETALCVSVKHNYIDIVKLLLSQQDIDVNHLSVYKRYGKYCKFNKKNIDEKYLYCSTSLCFYKQKWNVENAIEKETYELSPLYLAVGNNNIEIVKLLLSSSLIDINILNIELSYFWGNREIIIEKYQKPALFRAIEKEKYELVNILASDSRIDVETYEYYDAYNNFEEYDIDDEIKNYFRWEKFINKGNNFHSKRLRISPGYLAKQRKNDQIIDLLSKLQFK